MTVGVLNYSVQQAFVDQVDGRNVRWVAMVDDTLVFCEIPLPAQASGLTGSDTLFVVYQLSSEALAAGEFNVRRLLVGPQAALNKEYDSVDALIGFFSGAGVCAPLLEATAKKLSASLVDLSSPLMLQTSTIAKPWGQEIWYTGIEERGVCSLRAFPNDCPLPWFQSVLPSVLGGIGSVEPVLLKILDPHPEPVYGDLYFELHERKQEVYVITHISSQAWPSGKGGIRIGFNHALRQQYQDDEAFKQDYLKAVRQYRAVRYEVDSLLDAARVPSALGTGFASDNMQADSGGILTPQQQIDLHRVIPSNLLTQELALRQSMERFTQMHELALGDVVVIPRFTPHALQHGVRAVEFQTPVYERKIVSFAQKVLTQKDWDTEAALAVASMQPYEPALFGVEPLASGDCMREKIVDFDDFVVWRYRLSGDTSVSLDLAEQRYAVIMAVEGDLLLGAATIKQEQAAVLLVQMMPMLLSSKQQAIFLLAVPK